jgi:hypothetical protein
MREASAASCLRECTVPYFTVMDTWLVYRVPWSHSLYHVTAHVVILFARFA